MTEDEARASEAPRVLLDPGRFRWWRWRESRRQGVDQHRYPDGTLCT